MHGLFTHLPLECPTGRQLGHLPATARQIVLLKTVRSFCGTPRTTAPLRLHTPRVYLHGSHVCVVSNQGLLKYRWCKLWCEHAQVAATTEGPDASWQIRTQFQLPTTSESPKKPNILSVHSCRLRSCWTLRPHTPRRGPHSSRGPCRRRRACAARHEMKSSKLCEVRWGAVSPRGRQLAFPASCQGTVAHRPAAPSP